ncbi:MAG: potassium channel protein [Desulfomicrobiaceae bacterium]|nr:potassium channel protein [Desulfomicrobiaceae bacterium]
MDSPNPNSWRLGALYSWLRLRCGVFLPLVASSLVLLGVVAYGLGVFMVVEGWNFLDSFYQVVITLSTVGFMEVHPISERGRIFVTILILLGVGSFAYMVGAMTQVIVDGRLHDLWGKRKMRKILDTLEGHYIVCGFGRIGQVVAQEMRQAGHTVVVIERNPELLAVLQEEGYLFLAGDASEDQTLVAAGVTRAQGLFACVDTDAENVFITLSARQFRPDITIVARADRPDAVAKLERAGAQRVITPHHIGGRRIAQVMLRPTVTDFMDLALQGKNLQMEEAQVAENSPLAGTTLITSGIRPRFGLMIIAIDKPGTGMLFNPQPDQAIEAGDTLIAVGPPENFAAFQAAARGEAVEPQS